MELNKKFSRLQNLRKMRAENKGISRQLAAELRKTASWLEKQGPEELSHAQVKDLQLAAYMIGHRLYLNALSKGMADLMDHPEKYRLPDGTWEMRLSPKDLLDAKKLPVAAWVPAKA